MPCIIIALPRREDGNRLKGLLQKNGFHTAGVCTSGAQVLYLAAQYEDGGIVLCAFALTDMQFDAVRDSLPEGYELILMASAARLGTVFYPDLITLSMPLKWNALRSALEAAAERHRQWKKKRQKPRRTRSREEEALLTSAKELLMAHNHFTEPEAHRALQKYSMDSGINLAEAAERVLSILK